MGQRLTVTIKKNGKNIANCYFHWSGYTETAIGITNEVLDNLMSMENLKTASPLDIAMIGFSLAGYSTGLEGTESNYLNSEYPNVDREQIRFNNDRNEGLICISEKGMDDSIGAGEMLVNIDIGKETVVNEFLYPEDSDEDYGDCVMECAELRYDPQQELSFDEYFDMCRDLYDEDPREASDKRFMYKGTVYYPIA